MFGTFLTDAWSGVFEIAADLLKIASAKSSGIVLADINSLQLVGMGSLSPY